MSTSGLQHNLFRGMVRPGYYENRLRVHKRYSRGSRISLLRQHRTPTNWWETNRTFPKPFGIESHAYTPRVLLDRHMFGDRWEIKRNIPDASRWEKVVNGLRVTEDRWSLVEEEGKMHKVNWKLYSKRVESEMLASFENAPQYRYWMANIPAGWKKMDTAAAKAKGLSLREASAQMHFGGKHLHILLHALEAAQQGAEAKGLDKDKLRVVSVDVRKGPRDKAMDIKSKGFYAWKTLHSSHVRLVLGEDPEMVLPDRSAIPFQKSVSLAKAGVMQEPATLDVPAITADGI